MESANGHSSGSSNQWSRKRKPSTESSFASGRSEMETTAMTGDHRQSGNHDSERMQRLEAKNQELEMFLIRTRQDLQQECERLRSKNEELESRINHLERSSTSNTGGITQATSGRIFTPDHKSRERREDNLNLTELVNKFQERCHLVESDTLDLTERVDTCQQNFFKIRQKAENLEKQLESIQQNLNSVTIHDTQMHQDSIGSSSKADVDRHPNQSIIDHTILEKADDCTLIEHTLCTPCDSQISLSTDEIQYGLFEVCDKHGVILIKEKDKLKMFDYQRQIDERSWGEFGSSNFATCINWCPFLDCFLILYRFGLYTLSLKRCEQTSQMKFNALDHISSIRVRSLRFGPTDHKRPNGALEILRYITVSPNLPDRLFLNREYRRLELINTNSWKIMRGWSKDDLDYGARDRIKLITLSLDGSYLAMNIDWNDKIRFIDLRKIDGQLSLMKRIRMPDDSLSLRQRLQVPFEQNKWIVVDDNGRCYKVSTNPADEQIVPIITDKIQSIPNVTIYLRLVRDNTYLLVGSVAGDRRQKHGVLSFHKLLAR